MDRRRDSAGSRNSVSSSAGSQFESMFGMARRFPSIRMNSSAKKEEKKRRRRMSSATDASEEFPPRSGGNTIPLSFGQSIEQLYSKPSSVKHKSNTIVPIVGPATDSSEMVLNGESGSSCMPVEAVYKRSESVHSVSASLKRAMSATLSLRSGSLKKDEGNRSASKVADETDPNSSGATSSCCCDTSRLFSFHRGFRLTASERQEEETGMEEVEVPKRVEDVMRCDLKGSSTAFNIKL